jgi:hypothetical protein
MEGHALSASSVLFCSVAARCSLLNVSWQVCAGGGGPPEMCDPSFSLKIGAAGSFETSVAIY